MRLKERIIGSGFVRDARYHFTSVNPTIVNSQPPNGENWLNELDYLTGAVGEKLIYDLNADSKLTDGDRVQLANGDPVTGPVDDNHAGQGGDIGLGIKLEPRGCWPEARGMDCSGHFLFRICLCQSSNIARIECKMMPVEQPIIPTITKKMLINA